MKKVVFSIIVLMIVHACKGVSNIGYDDCDVFVVPNDYSDNQRDSLSNCTKQNIIRLIECYYEEYLVIPTPTQLLHNDFVETKISQEFANFYREKSKNFHIYNDDDYVYVDYYDKPFLKYSLYFGPYFWYEVAFSNPSFCGTIWAYRDESFQPLTNNQKRHFTTQLNSCVVASLMENYDYVSYSFDSVAAGISTPKLILLYQYDNKDGLSLHNISKQRFTLTKNLYSQKLENLAKEFCVYYGLSRIVFSGFALKNITPLLDKNED